MDSVFKNAGRKKEIMYRRSRINTKRLESEDINDNDN